MEFKVITDNIFLRTDCTADESAKLKDTIMQLVNLSNTLEKTKCNRIILELEDLSHQELSLGEIQLAISTLEKVYDLSENEIYFYEDEGEIDRIERLAMEEKPE